MYDDVFKKEVRGVGFEPTDPAKGQRFSRPCGKTPKTVLYASYGHFHDSWYN